MLENTLRSGFDEMGFAYCDETISKFRTYYDLLSEKNKVMNLTAISGEDESARLHFMDSITPLLSFDMKGKRVVDVGTGAGFPGLPLKIGCDEMDLTLIDSLRKRVDFLQEVVDAAGLRNVQCIHMRAEDGKDMREAYDFAVSRAVARLNILCELCLPYVKKGGYFLALKGPMLDEELPEAEKAIKLLGGTYEKTISVNIPGVEASHKIAVIKKTGITPAKYPRKFALIKKAPL